VLTAGNPGGGAFDGNVLSQAQNAIFSLNGVTGIERASNTVSDLVSGISFNLINSGSATVTVGTDTKETVTKVQEFVDAYNDIVTFLAEQNKIERQEEGEDVTNVFSPLAKTRIDDNALMSLRGDIAAAVAAGGSTVRIFADLGIKTQRDGTLELDQDTLEDALAAESDSVSELLRSYGDRAGLTGGTINQYTRFNGMIDASITNNEDRITDLNERIARAEASIAQQENTLKAQFARLEATMARMQSQQSQLTSILGSMG